ncbi:WD40 repeat-like protein, partial [Martensiomyces pterosporus]
TWDFLTNAAQMFDRAPELTEATMADTRKGFDLQGYQWRGYELQRRLYMSYRRQVYPQVRCVEHDVQEVRRQASCIDSTASMYQFRYSVLSDDYRCQINHFQLRDLIWATSNYDVFYYHADGVKRWNPWKRTSEFVLSWRQFPSTFRLSSLCAGNGVVFTGDYKGRYCVKSLWTGDIASGRLSDGCGDDIANHAAPCVTRTGVSQVHVAHNNGFVRQFDLERLAVTAETPFEWAVNCSAMAPDGSLECVVGDSTEGLLVDARASGSGRRAARLTGHKDYSFACSFSPDGRLVATGNQDTTVRVYDVRWPQQSLAVLGGYLGAMRVVRFSDCGRHLLAAEPADYVHVYDAVTLQRAQDIEVMGEISGATFSPDSNCLFMGVSDAIHGNALAEFTS